ncbi:MAG: protein translocase subunit SecD [Anaerolineae bacterium]|nr:MAG: protein translocase subunit SecD [Anaerolineae bacterium]
MNQRNRTILITLIPLIALALWVTWPGDLATIAGRRIQTALGLDLVGGVQVLLEADLPQDAEISAESMGVARQTIESRANGLLGVGEALVQQAGDRRIVVELPGESDTTKAINVIGETGQLEFVDLSSLPVSDAVGLIGQTIVTDYPAPPAQTVGQTVFHTVMTGESLVSASAVLDPSNRYGVEFALDATGAEIFRNYTATHTGTVLAIVLDKVIISAPTIDQAIPTGTGVISGQFTSEEANELAIQLRYGSLPIPLKVVQSRTIGPSLGEDSLRQSLTAGLIGLTAVMVFMLFYYRLPGLVADVALVLYALFTFALFKLIPITLTLPGIAGFILSIGVAVDANILIFERMREELRAGRKLQNAIEVGWDRAWSSIRDSNISTLITCAILFWFGGFIGASIVKSFAVTLALGVGVSLFTAITVTRALLHLALDRISLSDHRAWFGVKGEQS